jgi:feruloyl esterase
MEAQRFPEDFDGVVANAPWADQTGFTIGAMWNQKAMSEAPGLAAKMTLVGGAVMAKCDAVDGLLDGLIDDPRKCSFDPKVDVKACSAGQSGTDCLTAAEADALAKIYSGPVSNGKVIFPGYMLGSEANNQWAGMIAPANATAKPADFNLAENTMRYLVFTPPQPEWDYKTFDFDKDVHLLDAWSKQADAKDPDLSKFRKHGGKLLMTYGWADPILQPMQGVNYYEAAVAKNGKDTADFFRLFMVPGMAHCSGGIGPSQLDPMTAMIDWVEKGKAPTTIKASRVVNNLVLRTRPLCQYPNVARYMGTGSVDDAANFSCVAP